MVNAFARRLLLSFAWGSVANAAELRPKTLLAWERHVSQTEARIASELSSSRGFLATDFLPAPEAQKAGAAHAAGRVFVTSLEAAKDLEVPDGLVHHWLGSVLVPGAKLEPLLTWVQDYKHHRDFFDEVERSELLERSGDVFRIFLRLKRKKIVTVFYNTEHRIVYRRHDGARVSSRSEATRIAELDAPGTPSEREKPHSDDSGFLWRLHSNWRFEETPAGVIVECESLSLSRDIPTGLGWLIGGYVQSVPRESLERTLTSVREGFRGKRKSRS